MERRETAWLMSAASAPALARIASDERRASPRIKPLLGYLGRNLFSHQLNVRRLKRACGVRDNSISNRFHREIGTPPSAYIADRRMETAAWLLRETGVEVWRLSDLLGFSSLQVFSRAFARWSGLRPTAFRRRAARDHGAHEQVDGQGRATAVELPPVEAESGWLDTAAVEALRADAIWQSLGDQPCGEQRRLVRAAASPSPALFERIHRESREQGRADRRRGVELAELAVEAVAACDPSQVEPEVAGLKARAWAWVANAQALAVDFPAAERSFGRASSWLPPAADAPFANAEVLYLKSCLRLTQNRFEDSLALIDSALSHAQAAAAYQDRAALAPLLVQRGMVLAETDLLARAIADFEDALGRLSSADDGYVELSARFCLARCLVELGRFEEADRHLVQIENICTRLAQPVLFNQVLLLRATADKQRGQLARAERSFRRALEGFEELDYPLLAALTALEVAAVSLLRGNTAQVPVLAGFALKLLENLTLEREAIAAMEILRSAITCERITESVLEKALSSLRAGLGP